MSLPLGLVEAAIFGLLAFVVFSAVVSFLPRPIRPSQSQTIRKSARPFVATSSRFSP
jgi:hypothetical protein